MGLMMSEGKFVGRDEIALVPTPEATASWKPVPHSDVIDAVTEVVKAHHWQILEEQYGLARDGQRMFGVMRINRTSSTEWSQPLHRHPQQPRPHTGARIECRAECPRLFEFDVRRQYDLEASAYLPDRAKRPGSGSGEFT